MNIRLPVVALLLAVAPVGAQTTVPAPAAPQPVSTHATAAAATPRSPAPAPRLTDERPSSGDPRVCLEFSTREQVIACAERFRAHRGAAKT